MPRPALSATRSTMVLDLLAAHPDQPLSLSEVARRLDINASSAHAVMHALADVGYVQRDEELLWSLGPALVVIGAAASRRHPLIARARAALSELAEEHDLEGLLTTWMGDELLILESVRRAGPVATVGQRLPVIPPVAAIHVAHARADAQATWLESAPRRLRAAYRQLLDEIAVTGWVARQDQAPQPRLRRSLRHLQTHPTDRSAREAVADAVAALEQPASVLTEFSSRRSYDLAHVASLATASSGASVGMYLVGFSGPVRGTDAEALATALANRARLLSDQGPDAMIHDVM